MKPPAEAGEGYRDGERSGALSSETERETTSTSTTQSQSTEIAVLLMQLGLFLLSERTRLAVADRLQRAGVTVADVQEVHDYGMRSTVDAASGKRVVGEALQRAGEVSVMAERIRKYGTFEPVKAEPPAQHYPGFPIPYPGCRCSGCVGARSGGRADWTPNQVG